MAKLNASLKDICAGASQRITDLQSKLDAANKTIADRDSTIAEQTQVIVTLSASADPNITPDGIDAANALGVLVGVPAPADPAPPAIQ